MTSAPDHETAEQRVQALREMEARAFKDVLGEMFMPTAAVESRLHYLVATTAARVRAEERARRLSSDVANAND